MGMEIMIAVVDDDEDDRLLINRAFKKCGLAHVVAYFSSGHTLLNTLKRTVQALDTAGADAKQVCDTGQAIEPEQLPRLPGVILLDLNMPGMSGIEVLKHLKKSKTLHQIPVVVFTTSEAREDVTAAYNMGSSSFITKPVTSEALTRIVKDLHHYWLEVVKLPISPE
jgi:CheY-like chemotaxis protein